MSILNFFNEFFRIKPKDSSFPSEARKLPATMPQDLKIEISWGGTHRGGSETILASFGDSYTYKSTMMTGSEYRFSLDDEQMNQLFRILKKNDFDRIKTVEDIRLDYPSDRVMVRWGNSFISKGESQTEVMPEKWEGTYLNCRFGVVHALRTILETKLGMVEVRLGGAMVNENIDIYFSGRDTLSPYFYQSHPSDLFNKDAKLPDYSQPQNAMIIPGYTEWNVRWRRDSTGDSGKSTILFPEGSYGQRQLLFFLENKEVKWRIL